MGVIQEDGRLAQPNRPGRPTARPRLQQGCQVPRGRAARTGTAVQGPGRKGLGGTPCTPEVKDRPTAFPEDRDKLSPYWGRRNVLSRGRRGRRHPARRPLPSAAGQSVTPGRGNDILSGAWPAVPRGAGAARTTSAPPVQTGSGEGESLYFPGARPL